MKRILLLIVMIVIILLLVYIGFHIKWMRMFSPGELSYAHEIYDKKGECDTCHTAGKRLDNKKCLECHKTIKMKLEASLGLHGKTTKECADCHSEHHGREYDLAYFDKELFDHSSTGWALKGKHILLKCEACHRGDSYLLTNRLCIDCHKDTHFGQLGNDCNKCHNIESFKIKSYQHKPSDISPQGKHLSVPCDECHRLSTIPFGKGVAKAVKYKGIDFSCIRCHEDIHEGENGEECLECHNQDSFEVD